MSVNCDKFGASLGHYFCSVFDIRDSMFDLVFDLVERDMGGCGRAWVSSRCNGVVCGAEKSKNFTFLYPIRPIIKGPSHHFVKVNRGVRRQEPCHRGPRTTLSATSTNRRRLHQQTRTRVPYRRRLYPSKQV